MSELPDGWAKARLEELTVFILGGDWGKAPEEQLEDSDLARCIRASELRNWDTEEGKTAALRRLRLASLEKRTLAVDDLLVEISGGGPEQPVGRVVRISKQILAQNPEHPKVCTNFFRMVRLSSILNARFIEFYLQHFYAIGGVRPLQAGSNNLRNLKFPDYLDELVPIAPLNEQHRIVSKIEDLFTELDKGEESLRTARAQLGRYRQSLLKYAFEGHLTAEWRAQNPDRLEAPPTLLDRIQSERNNWYTRELQIWEEQVDIWRVADEKGPKPRRTEEFKKPIAIEDEELSLLSSIPSEWQFLRLCEIASVGSGMSVSKSRKHVDPVDVPYLRVANVQRGYLDLDEIKSMTIEKSQLWGLALGKNDVLFNEGGDRDKLGRGWIWEGTIDPCITQNHVFRATLFRDSNAWAKLVSYWGNTAGQQYFEKGGKQTTNLASINKTVLKAFPIPVMPPAEVEEIIRLVEAILSTIDSLETEVDAQLTRSKALRQSILKRAFSGQLVEQNPNDEPAAKLLERLRAETESFEKQTTRTPKKAGAKRRARKRIPTMADLMEILKSDGDWVLAADAAQQLGIGDGSSSDAVEAFYHDLRERVLSRAIDVERRGDEDWLRLAEAKVT